MYVVVSGYMLGNHTFFGPFATQAEAHRFADQPALSADGLSVMTIKLFDPVDYHSLSSLAKG